MRLHNPCLFAVLSMCCVAVMTAPAVAGPTLPLPPPSELMPYDQYRLAFVTSVTRNATSTDIADYNLFVDTAAKLVAELAALPADWKAIASTVEVDARDNTSTDWTPAGPTGVPIFRLDGEKIADNYDDLWDGALLTNLNVTEQGDGQGESLAWTGTINDGTRSPYGALGEATPQSGVVQSSEFWILYSSGSSGEQHKPLYAISGVLTVPNVVPEPGSITLLGMGAGLLGTGRLRRRRKQTRSSH